MLTLVLAHVTHALLFARTTEDWEKDILASVTQYCGFVDANMLCLLWPLQMQGYRVCFISGPLTRPLISVFQPPAPSVGDGSASVSEASAVVEGLTEIVIRCSGDHFTLLRPLHAPAGFKVPHTAHAAELQVLLAILLRLLHA